MRAVLTPRLAEEHGLLQPLPTVLARPRRKLSQILSSPEILSSPVLSSPKDRAQGFLEKTQEDFLDHLRSQDAL